MQKKKKRLLGFDLPQKILPCSSTVHRVLVFQVYIIRPIDTKKMTYLFWSAFSVPHCERHRSRRRPAAESAKWNGGGRSGVGDVKRNSFRWSHDRTKVFLGANPTPKPEGDDDEYEDDETGSKTTTTNSKITKPNRGRQQRHTAPTSGADDGTDDERTRTTKSTTNKNNRRRNNRRRINRRRINRRRNKDKQKEQNVNRQLPASRPSTTKQRARTNRRILSTNFRATTRRKRLKRVSHELINIRYTRIYKLKLRYYRILNSANFTTHGFR